MQPAVVRQRLALALVASLWVLPLLLPLSQRPLLHFHREWLAASLALGACLLWLPLRGQTLALPRSALFLVALAAWLLLQTLLVRAPYREPALGYALYLAWAALLMSASTGLRERFGVEAVVRAICWAALGGALLAAAVGLMQAFGTPEALRFAVLQDRHVQVFGNLRHASYFADQLLMGVAAAASLHATGRLRAWLLVPALLPIALALALTGSRVSVLVLVLLPLVASFIWLVKREAPARRLLVASALAPALFLACEWALHALPFLAERLAGSSTLARLPTDGAGMDQRLVLWREALRIFAAAPLRGAGTDSFAWHYFIRLDAPPPLPYTIHSHNLFTESLASWGLPGTALLAALLGAFAWQYRARLLDLRWWPVSAMLGILFVRALLDLNFWYAHLLALAAVLLGVADLRGVRLRTRVAAPALGVAAVAGVVLLGFTALDYRRLTGIGETRTDAREVLAGLQLARRNPFFTALSDSMRADGMPVRARGDRVQLALHSRSYRWRPTPRMVWRQSTLLAANGYPEEACRLMARAWRIHPRSVPGARKLIARNADTPAFATLLGRLDALVAGGDERVVCGR